MYPKEFSIVLYLLLVAICAYLLCAGKLTSRDFMWSLLLTAFAVAVLHNLDTLRRLVYKGPGGEATAEFEQIKKDVYAKADAVRQMTEAVAGLIAEEVATAGRFGGTVEPDPVAHLIQSRDKLHRTLANVGTPEDHIKQLLAPFEQWIPFDLRNALITSAQTAAQQKGWKPQQLNEFGQELSSLLQREPHLVSLNQAERRIHDADLSSSEITLAVDRYRSYLTNGDLTAPKSGK
jgi:hypothetical protein